MNLSELFFGILIVLVLFGVAGYFGWQQIQGVRTLRNNRDLPAEHRTFLRRQIRRRLICCMLMILFAGSLIGWLVMEPTLIHLLGQDANERSETPVVEIIVYYWIFALMVLFGMLALAGFDLVATARFGLRSHRLLEIERRAVLEAEAARLRKKRHEGNGA